MGKGKKKAKSAPEPKKKDPKEEAPKEVEALDDVGDRAKGHAVEDFYTEGAEIGRGGMSIVKEGTDKKTGRKWALKYIEKNIVDDMEVLEREINIMRRLRHRHVLGLREVFESSDQFCLVTELVTGGELFEKIVEVGSYSEKDAGNIVRQVLLGVEYLHANGVAHRDLKPENLLVGGKDEDEIKIADFGLSKSFGAGAESALETSCGTPDYVAPEVLRGEVYDQSVDLWSIGVITYILLCGFPPFWGESQGELFDKILSVEYDFPDPEWTQVSDEAKDFIKHLLVGDPNERHTATQCLQHPWMKSIETSEKKSQLRSLESVRKLKDYNEKRKKAAK